MYANIIIIGDSNTQGYGLLPSEKPYPSILNHLLGENCKVHNMGLSGSCVTIVEEDNQLIGMPYIHETIYKDALNIQGELYIINLGTNDAKDDTSINGIDKEPYQNLIKHKDLFIPSYTTIIKAIMTKYPEAKIMVCLPIPIRKSVWPAHKQDHLDQLMPLIREISTKENLELIDLYSPFMGLNDIDDYYLSDGLHLNQKGHQKVAQIFFRRIQ